MTPSMGIIFAVMTVLNQAMTTLGLDKADLYDRQEVYCGAQNVYFESQGEPRLGMVAGSQVVLNRVKNKRWPNTICEVIWQRSGLNECGLMVMMKVILHPSRVGHISAPDIYILWS